MDNLEGQLKAFIADVITESISLVQTDLDLLQLKLETLKLALSNNFMFIDWIRSAVVLLNAAITLVEEEIESSVIIRSVGRPTIPIPISTIEYLLSVKFKAIDIAKIFGVCRETIFRRMRENGLSVRGSYTQISDLELNERISRILASFPSTGYKRMKGFLLFEGVKITDLRMREAMRIADPIGVHLRTLSNRAIVRRQYFVSYFNELWHLDTNMKLIRWNIVIRSCIDGKTRLVVYLDASGDNCSDSNLISFLKAVSLYGIPSRTRSDKGGENVGIAQFMIEQRGLGRSSHICGRSVHNQRIERYWRDVFYGYTGCLYNMFSTLEMDGMLDIDNPKHITVLHKVFLPRINQCLETFRNAWNSHPLSSENNYSPQQLMILNMPPMGHDLQLTQEELDDVDFVCNSMADAQLLLSEDDDTVTTPLMVQDSLSTNEILRLTNIDVFRESSSLGYDIFVDAISCLE